MYSIDYRRWRPYVGGSEAADKSNRNSSPAIVVRLNGDTRTGNGNDDDDDGGVCIKRVARTYENIVYIHSCCSDDWRINVPDSLNDDRSTHIYINGCNDIMMYNYCPRVYYNQHYVYIVDKDVF